MPGEDAQLEESPDALKDKAIEIDLDKPDGKEADKVSSEPKYVTIEEMEKIRKQLNGLSYIGRQFESVSKKIDAILQKEVPLKQGDDVPSEDPLDKLVEKDWKQAVRKLAREEADTLRKEDLRAWEENQLRQTRLNVLEDSKKKVLEKYPEINDPESDLSKRYTAILNKNQDYLRNERGPILAMRDMEDELREEGRLDEFTKRVVEKEVSRQVRVAATALPHASNGSSPKGKVSLTREQKEICDQNGIKYETYAAMLKKQEVSGRQGVEV